MHFGMPTLIELNSLKENVELCKKLKLNFIELNMNIPLFSVLGIEDENNFELKKIIDELNFYQKEFGIYFTIHLDENFNFADSNIYIKNAYLKTLKAVIKNSKKINCPIINMHLNKGIYFTLPTEKVFLFEKYKEEFNNSLEEFIKFCNCEISDSNIFISIENTDGWTDFEKKSIEKILMNKNFSLTFDIGHSQAIGNIDQDFILKNKSKLKHFHIHDGTLPNAATKQFGKNHLQLGTGNINLKEKIYLAKETNSRCVIETKTVESLVESVKWITKSLDTF
ncbi:MAG: sugar phosphate isomerase/epimerase [Spirochaetaceae bacterium]|nr:sugar phosphate isomerase/epimerase [Spirochaetaceae bacterium]